MYDNSTSKSFIHLTQNGNLTALRSSFGIVLRAFLGLAPACLSNLISPPSSLPPQVAAILNYLHLLRVFLFLILFHVIFFMLGISFLFLPEQVGLSFSQTIIFLRNPLPKTKSGLQDDFYTLSSSLCFRLIINIVMVYLFLCFSHQNQKPVWDKQPDLYGHLLQRCLIYYLMLIRVC